ncbi:MAG: hypothetical protein KC561_03290 [Myxococcales bacterium]|nr:hypothetical protein [Myxococcales bacterium]
MDQLTQKALAANQLSALVSAGVGLSEALVTVGDALPSGSFANTIKSLASRSAAGEAVDGRLDDAFGLEFRVLQESPPEQVPLRLQWLAAHFEHLLRLGTHLRGIVAYPVLVAALGLAAMLIRAGLSLRSEPATIFAYTANDGGVVGSLRTGIFWFALLLSAAFFTHSVIKLRQGAIPLWARLFPGGRCERLAGQSHYMSSLSLLMQLNPGLAPKDALAALADRNWTFRKNSKPPVSASLAEHLRALRFPRQTRRYLKLAWEADCVSEAAGVAAERLAFESEQSVRRFQVSAVAMLYLLLGVMATSLVLLLRFAASLGGLL